VKPIFLVIDRHVQEGGEVVELALHVGVEQGGVALAAAPEGVAFRPPSSWVARGLFHLGGGVGETSAFGRGGGTLE
jgi:hypothetical protein